MTCSRVARPTVLLTGFAPFPGVDHNPSADLAAALSIAARLALPEHRVVARVLPTEWDRGPSVARSLYEEFEPEIAVHFGVASRCRGFEIEMRAENRTSDTEDARGLKPNSDVIMTDGPARIGVSLPTRRILWALRSQGLPAKLSMDCGGYICNAVLYHALALTHATGRLRRLGFVHVPKTLAIGRHRVSEGEPSQLSAGDAIVAGLELLTVTHRAGAPRRHD